MGRKILLVEDDRHIARALSLRLVSLGHTVLVAGEGEAALSTAVSSNPDLVLLDINLPGDDGLSIARRMQSIPQISATPFAFLTASRQPGLRERAAELGAIAFLEKPFTTADLIEAVELSQHATEDAS